MVNRKAKFVCLNCASSMKSTLMCFPTLWAFPKANTCLGTFKKSKNSSTTNSIGQPKTTKMKMEIQTSLKTKPKLHSSTVPINCSPQASSKVCGIKILALHCQKRTGLQDVKRLRTRNTWKVPGDLTRHIEIAITRVRCLFSQRTWAFWSKSFCTKTLNRLLEWIHRWDISETMFWGTLFDEIWAIGSARWQLTKKV